MIFCVFSKQCIIIYKYNGVLKESILDQVLFTNEALVTDIKLLSSFGKSDHVSMKIELGVSLGKEPPPETRVI